MGWTGRSFRDYRCWYIALFPAAILELVSCLVLSVIVMVVVLYILILHSAVKQVDKIREYRETNTISYISKAVEDQCRIANNVSKTKITITISKDSKTETAETSIEMRERSTTNLKEEEVDKNINRQTTNRVRKVSKISTYYGQAKELNAHPSKLKAVKTVLIVIICFVCTWAPYYVAIIVYVRCDIMKNGYDCLPIEVITHGPLFLLGACNSLCDPIIYAWRHSGFKKSLKRMYWKYVWKMKTRNHSIS